MVSLILRNQSALSIIDILRIRQYFQIKPRCVSDDAGIWVGGFVFGFDGVWWR
jgi:hypothetical protein